MTDNSESQLIREHVEARISIRNILRKNDKEWSRILKEYDRIERKFMLLYTKKNKSEKDQADILEISQKFAKTIEHREKYHKAFSRKVTPFTKKLSKIERKMFKIHGRKE
jgi:hypothetical protein